jgi:D-glycero-D-manno-heptose 1,7-bisphosphate phosphatase
MIHPSVVFLDRDGTIINDEHYLARPEQVRLLDGAAEAIARLNEGKIPVILITNQSGIARGYFTVADYERVHARLTELLSQRHAHLDATYYCPHDPDSIPPCSCRKPGTLLFQRAIKEHKLDPARAVSLGDRWRDLAPAIALGGTGILIPSPDTPAEEIDRAKREASVSASLSVAVSRLL